MNKSPLRIRVNKKILSLVALPLLLGACTTLAPALASLGIAIGQDLLAAASVNYAPRYASQLETLLSEMARTLTGLNLQPVLSQQGYRPPPPAYIRKMQENADAGAEEAYYEEPYAQSDPYEQQASEDPYEQGEFYYEDVDTEQVADDGYSEDPYAGEETDPDYDEDTYVEEDLETYSDEDPYAQEDLSDDPYSQPADDNLYVQNPVYQTRGLVPIAMDVALLAQRVGSSTLAPIEDGSVLVDGRGDPAAGDLFKVHFSTNCNCYVYVIGVDATGSVAQIFPDPDGRLTNPVDAGRVYILPEGNDWWGLDNFQGVEQIFFVAAYGRREKVEAAIEQLLQQKQEKPGRDYQPVKKAAFIVDTRGIVKVKAIEPIRVQTSAGVSKLITPDSFYSKSPGAELVITRWFNHE